MAKEKAHIIVMQNGVPIGYIKSVSYSKGTFQITTNKVNAKGYTTHDRVQAEIDDLTRIGYSQGYVFCYD